MTTRADIERAVREAHRTCNSDTHPEVDGKHHAAITALGEMAMDILRTMNDSLSLAEGVRDAALERERVALAEVGRLKHRIFAVCSLHDQRHGQGAAGHCCEMARELAKEPPR